VILLLVVVHFVIFVAIVILVGIVILLPLATLGDEVGGVTTLKVAPGVSGDSSSLLPKLV
jgi:hypothetical protein